MIMDLLVVSTLSCILDHIAPFLIKSISTRLFAQKRYNHELWNELNDLKHEMADLSMVNEFAKYAKLQRKCNKLENTLKENISLQRNRMMKLQLSLTYIFRILNGILILSLSYMYKSVAVIVLPEGTLWPIQNLLSWPCQNENAISLIAWIVITRLGGSACRKLNVI